MAGLVEEIQALALDQTVRIADLLRRVKLAAVKLQLTDTADWVDRELKGYEKGEEVPAYRQTVGQLKAHTPFHGVVPVTGNSPLVDDICKTPIWDSVAKIEVLAGDGTQEVAGKVTGPFEDAMNKAHGTRGTEYYVHSPQAVFLDILDQVRNLVLDWAIGLEKIGILGEGISFSVEEKQKAQTAPSINIENFTGHLHQGDVTGHQNRTVVASTDNSTSNLEIDATFRQLNQAITSQIENGADREALLEIAAKLHVAQGTSEYKPWFQKLVGYAAEYATVLSPFLPALSRLIPT